MVGKDVGLYVGIFDERDIGKFVGVIVGRKFRDLLGKLIRHQVENSNGDRLDKIDRMKVGEEV